MEATHFDRKQRGRLFIFLHLHITIIISSRRFHWRRLILLHLLIGQQRSVQPRLIVIIGRRWRRLIHSLIIWQRHSRHHSPPCFKHMLRSPA